MAKQADFEAAQAAVRADGFVPDHLRLASITRAIAAGGLPVARLCYIDRPWAYFTTAPLADQWGDDWNDATYEHNAGSPYAYAPYMQKVAPYEIVVIAFDAFMLETPADRASLLNSQWSVEQINAQDIPWLSSATWTKPEQKVEVWAGATIEEFCAAVRLMDGRLYFERKS